MKQYKITTENLNLDDANDAYLSPEDPIHELKIAGYLGGLGSEVRLAEYRLVMEQNKYRVNKK